MTNYNTNQDKFFIVIYYDSQQYVKILNRIY